MYRHQRLWTGQWTYNSGMYQLCITLSLSPASLHCPNLHAGGLMEDLDNKWILNASSSSQDCREKDGNNPVTLGLENMRGVSAI